MTSTDRSYNKISDDGNDESNPQSDDRLFRYVYTGQRPRFEIPSNITVLAIDFIVERIEEAAFANQHDLQAAFIPPTVRRIERAAFTNCSSLSDLELVEGQLEAIESMAFAQCMALTEISIPSTVEEIGDNAFMSCTGLVDLLLQREGKLKKICEHAFRKCEALQKVAIPSSVHRIEEFSFDGCSSLVELGLSMGLQDICRNAFSMCVSLKMVDIPYTVIALGEGSFSNCKALVDVNMSSGLAEILENAFEGCCSLQAVSIPETVYWIGDRAFNFCIALVSVELPTASDIGMGEGVFNMCKNLVNIAIPKNTSNLDESAFVGCRLLNAEHVGHQIAGALKERFKGFPIHKLCYHACSTTEEELVLAAKSANGTNPDAVVDAFGMTPFHILTSASGKQRVGHVRALADIYPTELLIRRDRYGNHPLGYLCTHVSQNVHDLFQTIVQQTILDLASQLRLRVWRMEILDLASPLQDSHQEWLAISYAERRNCVGEVYAKLEKYVLLEKTSLLEVALWKANMDDDLMTEVEDRSNARFTNGASIVIPQVMVFLL
ncbi:MAG: hypothetical protein SGBAC_003742 [Bacillariaceae sp.]